jgi:predicted Zn-dependent peptidase
MRERFFKKRLENGVTVILEKRELKVVSVGIANRFGGAFEDEKVKGIAHVIEHLLFTGTKTRTHEDISREIEKKGGILNAFTANEVTNYWFKLPSEHLFAGLGILVDMLNNPKFDPVKFEKEKKVILEEIKMYHDSPDRDVYRLIEEALYEKPFGVGIIGTKESVSSLKRDFVKEYFEMHYNPENFIVTIVGNADFEKVCAYFEKAFEKKPGKLMFKEIKKKNAQIKEEREGIDQAHLIFAVHSPLSNEKDFYAMQVLDAYLAEGMSSKMFLKIREEKGLAYAIRSSMNNEKSYSYYTIYVGTMKDKVEEVKKLILEEFKKVEKEMNEKDLNEAKTRLIGLRRVSSEESANVMNSLMYEEVAGKAEDYYEYEKKVMAVKLEDVKKLAKIKKYSTAEILPK